MSFVAFEQRGPIGVLTMNRPEALNALNEQVLRDLDAALDAVEANDEVLVVILTATIGALKTFAPVYLLTKGGPGTSTTVPSYYSYNQFFQVQQVGYGAAISTALTVVIIVFSIVFTLVQKHVEKELV